MLNKYCYCTAFAIVALQPLLAQDHRSIPGGRICNYVFRYDISADQFSAPPNDIIQLPSIELSKRSWSEYLSQFPPLSDYAKRDVWRSDSIEVRRDAGWRPLALLRHEPLEFSPSGLPFEVTVMLDDNGRVDRPIVALYDSFGAIRTKGSDDCYIQAVLWQIDKLKTTELSEEAARVLATTAIAETSRHPSLQEVEHLSANGELVYVQAKLELQDLSRFEAISGVVLWKATVKVIVFGESKQELETYNDAFNFWLSHADKVSTLTVENSRSQLLEP